MAKYTVHAFVAATVLAAIVASATLDWSLPVSTWRDGVGVTLLVLLGLLSEASGIKVTVGKKQGNASITLVPLIGCLIIFGPAAATAFFVITGGLVELVIRKKEAIRSAFNIAQYALTTALGGIAFTMSGGLPLHRFQDLGETFPVQIGPLVAFGLVFIVVNHVLVSVAITVSEQRRFSTIFRRALGQSMGSIASDVFTAPLGVLVAFLYFHFWIGGLFISLLPLVFIRHAFIAKERMENANRDLLQALVKAIEVRDSYTSGHSVRVQNLAVTLGEALGLGERKLEELQTAALLHDIGKVEVVYEQILMKPGKLSKEEFEVMQSHVTRGVEILQSLSSFDGRIIGAVRHHHENYNGSGYPDGVAAEGIPLFARIIKVSDSIDAMLSDRPYRSAMTPERVTNILVETKGIEYDPVLVEKAIELDLIRKHDRLLRTEDATGAPVWEPEHPTQVGAIPPSGSGLLAWPLIGR